MDIGFARSDVIRAFADITELSNFANEKEVLFSLLTNFCVKDVGDRADEQEYGWVLITLELINPTKDNHSYNLTNFAESIEGEKNPQNYIDVVNFIKEGIENQERFNYITWDKWWSIMEKQWGTHAARDQPLLLTLYQCFREDKDYSRKAVEMHKHLLRTIPKFQPNQLSFSNLLNTFTNYQCMPTKQIAVFEQYLQSFCFEKTNKTIQCLFDAGITYENISDKERAFQCYKKILELDQSNEFRKHDEIQKRIKILKKTSKADRIVNKERVSADQDTKKEAAKIPEINQRSRSNRRNMNTSTVHKLPILNRIRELKKCIHDLDKWYDAADSKIILRLQSQPNSDFSVNDYRVQFFVAVQKHISLTPETIDATNHVSLTRWRYKKYMYVWISLKKMEGILKLHKKRLECISEVILPRLERFLKKLTVMIVTTIVYLCIEPSTETINVKKMPSFDLKKAEMSEQPWFKILNENLLRDIEALPEETSTTKYTSVAIPDDKRFVEESFADFLASFPCNHKTHI
ncbi:unnamed protein product [Rotaria sp. Silwood2]|nr:unnamed protein product [Rotaria sp. Silwood2]